MKNNRSFLPLGSSISQSLTRQVILILPNLAKMKTRHKKEESRLMANTESLGIYGRINKSIEKLMQISSRMIPKIKIIVDSKHGWSDLLEIINSVPHNQQIRILVLLNDHSTEINKISVNKYDYLKKIGISHLVEIRTGKKKYSWSNSENISTVSISISEDKTEELIEDIVLDIAMFHSCPYLDDNYNSTQEFKYTFSKHKFAYIKSKGLLNKYGSIEDELDYISFATAFRVNGILDYSSYDMFWDEFVATLFSDNEFNNIKKDKSVQQQLKSCVFYKQLPIARVFKCVASLPQGTYLLLRISKNPYYNRDKIRINTIMGGQKYRIGKYKVVPFNQLKNVVRYYPWLSIFKFEVQ